MKNLTLIAVIVLALVSCAKKRTYYILTSRADNVTEETKLFHRGVEIGTVDRIGFSGNKILLECSIEKYIIKNTDSLKLDYNNGFSIIIDVLSGRNGIALQEGDTIVQDLGLKSGFNVDKIVEKIEQKLDEMIEIDSVKRRQIKTGK